jgi:hypothetical protein
MLIVVELQLAQHKVTLGQKLRVKVDGKRVEKMPFAIGTLLELRKEGEYIVLTTHLGKQIDLNH